MKEIQTTSTFEAITLGDDFDVSFNKLDQRNFEDLYVDLSETFFAMTSAQKIDRLFFKTRKVCLAVLKSRLHGKVDHPHTCVCPRHFEDIR